MNTLSNNFWLGAISAFVLIVVVISARSILYHHDIPRKNVWIELFALGRRTDDVRLRILYMTLPFLGSLATIAYLASWLKPMKWYLW